MDKGPICMALMVWWGRAIIYEQTRNISAIDKCLMRTGSDNENQTMKDSMIRGGLSKEVTFEMRAEQQKGAGWTEIRVEGPGRGESRHKDLEVEMGFICLGSESPPLSIHRSQLTSPCLHLLGDF